MQELNKIREDIDDTDNQLLNIVSKRLSLIEKVKHVKRKLNIPVKDQSREDAIIKSLSDKGKKLGISEGAIKKIWKILFEESYKIEE